MRAPRVRPAERTCLSSPITSTSPSASRCPAGPRAPGRRAPPCRGGTAAWWRWTRPPTPPRCIGPTPRTPRAATGPTCPTGPSTPRRITPPGSGRCRRPVGVASYLRIDPAMGCIEVGHLSFAPALQRTAAATEAMYLMMCRVFDELGYRRYEWKCDSLNAPSLSAARRLGFRYEGTFRQAVVSKGRNRDTAWFSITDKEWPAVRSSTRTDPRDDGWRTSAAARRPKLPLAHRRRGHSRRRTPQRVGRVARSDRPLRARTSPEGMPPAAALPYRGSPNSTRRLYCQDVSSWPGLAGRASP
jgi:RimJ/RimL family protein N-acetyltransferase